MSLTVLQTGIYTIINSFVRLLIKIGFATNILTIKVLVLNVGVDVVFITGGEGGNLRYVSWGGALILFAGLFDMLDGQVARLGNMKSECGTTFYSVLDHYGELFNFLGICYYLVAHHYLLGLLFTFVALIGSMMVSYTRAQAEGLSVECRSNLIQRPERLVLLIISTLTCSLSSTFLGGDYKLFMPGVPFHVFETMSILMFLLTVLAVLFSITAVSQRLQAKKALALRVAPAGPLPALPRKVAAPAAAVALAVGLSFSNPSLAGGPEPHLVFPTPSGVANQLFYLQREPNTNTVIYQLNVNSAGQLDEDEPINVFWIRYTEQGQREDLNFIQRKFAYGLSAKRVGPNKYELKFAAYDKMPFYLMKSSVDNAYHVFTSMANKQIALTRVYLHIEGGTFWVPNVKYIEFKGWNATTREPTVARVDV